MDDVALRKEGIIRIYDIIFDAEVLFKTDDFIAEVLKSEEFQKRMSTAEMHWAAGPVRARAREACWARAYRSLIGAAWECRRARLHLQPR